MDEKIFFVHFFMQSNGLYIRVIDEKLFKTTKEVTALTRDIDYIVDKFSDDIYRAALAVTGSVHEAEDIVSEVIIKYFTRQGELFFNDDEHLKAWLLRTAINLSKDLLRSAGRRLRAENEVSASSDFSSPDMQIDVQNAINRLDEKYRIVLYLFYYQGVRQIHESSRVPVIASMETVMATVLGMLVLGEKLTVTRYLGIIIVMFSIVLMQQRKIVPDATAQNNSAM